MSDRREFILRRLAEKECVRVTDLAEEYGCSEVTIRKDIKAMDAEGLLVRLHGGAVRMGDGKKRQESYEESLNRNREQKRQIAARAYEFLEDRDTIIIDDASTCFYLAEQIKEHPEKRLAVVTNSLMAGLELSGLRHVELYMVGGYVGGYMAASMGEEAAAHMKEFHVDKAFIGVHGINFEAGLTSIATPQMQIKQAILKASEEVYVLADSSKFRGGYLTVICPIEAVDKIITDHHISKVDQDRAKQYGIPLVTA